MGELDAARIAPRPVLARRPPARPVSARELADLIVSTIEGGYILARAYNDPYVMVRLLKQFRQYLELLFEDAGAAGKSARA